MKASDSPRAPLGKAHWITLWVPAVQDPAPLCERKGKWFWLTLRALPPQVGASSKEFTCQCTKWGFDPGGEDPWIEWQSALQYSCSGNPMDRGPGLTMGSVRHGWAYWWAPRNAPRCKGLVLSGAQKLSDSGDTQSLVEKYRWFRRRPGVKGCWMIFEGA